MSDVTHDLFEPKLRVGASGYLGSGYLLPTVIDPATNKPRRVPGVTTVLGHLPKDGIVSWAVSNTVAYCVARVDAILDMEESVAYEKFRWYWKRTPKPDDPETNPLNYHQGVLHDAAEHGTFVHDWIESHWLGFIEPEIQTEDQYSAIEAYLKWEAEHDIEIIDVEKTVVNEPVGYAGTLDGIVKIDGVRLILDLKTARALYESHIAQVAALMHGEYVMDEVDKDSGVLYRSKKWGDTYWSTSEMPVVDGGAILRVRHDDYDNNGEFVPAHVDLRVLSDDEIEHGWGLFQGVRQSAEHMKWFRKELK